MAPIDPLLTYYLKNVESQNYLNAQNTGGSSANALVRPKVENALFQWKFLPSSPGTYYIQNMGNSQFLSYNADARFNVVTTQVSVTPLVVTQTSVSVTLVTPSGLYIYDYDKTSIYVVNTTDIIASLKGWNRNQWILEPVANSVPNPNPNSNPNSSPGSDPNPSSLLIKNMNPLPQGNYRIRSFNSQYLLTMPEDPTSNPYIDEQLSTDGTQLWTVAPVSNSTNLYTFYNEQTKLYLAASPSKKIDGANLISQSVAAGESAFQWTVETFGPGVMFFIGLTDVSPTLSIGFSNYQPEALSTVSLKTSGNIPSQIWFFENALKPTSATFHAERILDPTASYTIEIAYNNKFLSVDATTKNLTQSPAATATQFTIIYDDAQTPAFIISYLVGSKRSYLSTDSDSVRVTTKKSKATEWVFLPLDDEAPDEVCHICEVDSDDPRRAMSSRMFDDGGTQFFALDPLAEQEVMQMWKFHT